MSGSSLTEGGGKHPSAALGGKSPVLLGLRDKAQIALFSKLSNFYFDLRPQGRPPGKTEERKSDPWGN